MVRVGSVASKFGGCFMVLFAIPFASGGAVTAYLSWNALYEHQRMKAWQEVPCEIVGAALQQHRGSKGGVSYETRATFRYSFDGREYVGQRVSLHSGADNIGSFQQRVFAELDAHRRAGQPYRCYVNPEHPDQAILFPTARWELLCLYSLFAYVFGGIGIGALLGGLWKSVSRGSTPSADAQQPWLGNPQWAQGSIRYSTRATALVLWIAAALAVVFAVPTLWVCGEELRERQNLWASIGLAYPAISGLLMLWAWRVTLAWRKYGESVFQMATVPGLVGGPLAGVIRTSARVEAENGFLVTLRCKQRITTGRGKGRRTTETVLWEARRRIIRPMEQDDPDKIGIPVLFAIPFQAQPTRGSQGDDVQVVWTLDVKAETPGIDYSAEFEVPVFRTGESRADFQLDETAIAAYTAPPENPA